MPKIVVSQSQKLFHPQEWSIDRFEIGRPLGRGKYLISSFRFGHVYLAREKEHKFIVALKVLSKKQIVNSNVIGQIRREIEIHTHLNHPNILKMYGFFWDRKKIYYIMEYAPSGELYKHLRKEKKFPEHKVAKYIKQMASALKYVHKCKVFHRDIKPENILVCKNDQLKISDFGWSVRALTTQRKTMCGTLDYLCPEIIEGKFYDESVDIWALGVLAYELATGTAPFANRDRQVQYKNIRNTILKYPDYLSSNLVDFISLLLRRKPAERMSIEEALKHPWIKLHT
jgi:serine/threonine protein kinase